MKKLLSLILIIVLCVAFISPHTVQAAVKINKAKATMEVDSTLKLKVSDTKSKIAWKTNKKAVATVNSTGTVTAKSEGQATITATVGSKKYTCAVTVVDSNKPVKEKKLSDLVEYMKSEGVLTGKETMMDASMIGGVSGVKYSGIELYEFDEDSAAYKDLVKTNKFILEVFDMEIDVNAINGKFIILSDNKDAIEVFKNFK